MGEQNKSIIEGSIWKNLLLFFFPILLGTFLQQLYNTVDALIVGRAIGKEALAAVGGVTSYLINLLLNFFVGLCSGATVVIAQFCGAGDTERAGEAVHSSMALALVAGVLFSLVGIGAAEWALGVMNTPAEIMPYAATYLRIYYGGLIFMFVYNMGASALRAKGDSRRPFYLLIVATIVNIAADLLFVVVLKMGVGGAAWATVASQAACAVGVWIMLAREKSELRLTSRGLLHINFHVLGSVIRIGLPSGLQSSTFTVSNLFIQTAINGFGVDTAAAWATFGKMDHFFWMVLTALGVAISTFAGQNFGARKYDRVMKSVWVTFVLSLGFAIGCGFVFVKWGPQLMGIFTTDAGVISIGMMIARILPPCYFLYTPIVALAGGMRGTGDSVTPTVMTATGICVLRLLWIWCVLPFWYSSETLFIGYPVSWALTSAIFLLYHWKGNWLERSIIRAGHRR